MQQRRQTAKLLMKLKLCYMLFESGCQPQYTTIMHFEEKQDG
jgi:hypothetical protein